MDGVGNVRERSFKINGAAQRPASRNKQWLAPNQDGHANGGDGQRWERGGGPARGRGRGRGRGSVLGSGLSTPHLTVPQVNDDGASGTEDEAMTDVEEVEVEAEAEIDMEAKEKEPDTPEERERFYQELVKARDAERKRAIAEGKMDDPLVPKRLDEAITMVGTCLDMCPRFERYRRERENNLDRWEVIPGTKRVDHKRAVKIYERAAGDKTLPSDLRPPPILKKTLDYLFHDLIPRGGFTQTYGFIRDRSRAVRSDFTMQHETGPLAMECHDRCARFHILALHLERENTSFSVALEEQQLMNTLQSLKEFYEDQRGRYASPTELEMRIYHRLIHIRDQKERHEDIPSEIASHPVFQLTTKFRIHVQAKSAPINKTSRLVVDNDGMQIFAELAAVLRKQNNVVMIYLVACIMERLFGKDTIDNIEAIRGELSLPQIIDGISMPRVDSEIKKSTTVAPGSSPTKRDPRPFPISSNLQPPAVHTPTSAQSAFSSTDFTSSPAMQPQPGAAPVQSAFSALVSSPNVFGSVPSAFGRGPFGTVPSSTSPTSVFGGLTFATSAASLPASQLPMPQQAPSVQAAPSFFAHSTPDRAGASASFQTPPAAPVTIAHNPSLYTQANISPSNHTPHAGHAPADIPLRAAALNPAASALTPFKPTPQEPNPVFIPNFVASPTALSTASPEKSGRAGLLSSAPTLPATSFTTSPSRFTDNASSQAHDEPRIVERAQTLWDLPSTTPASLANISALKQADNTAPSSPVNPPPLSKPEPLALPPTPTTRWFESPFSQIKPQGSSMNLRKQSLGLLGLQMPDSPLSAEILSPLTLATPRNSLSHALETASPSPLSRVSAAERIASTSRTPHALSAPRDTKGQQADVDVQTEASVDANVVPHVVQKALAAKFARRGTVVRACFRLWQKKTTDRAAWAEACRRSDIYKQKVQRHRLSRSPSYSPSKLPESRLSKRRLSENSSLDVPRHDKYRRRSSGQYKPPVTDDALAKHLKENHEQHQRRWAKGSFLHAIRSTVSQVVSGDRFPPQWRIWLSMNAENDGTAIWLERKFDVPESGEWVPGNIFSIPVVPKSHDTTSGSPGLIVFERTPLSDLDDVLESKYRILDDCARLREVAEQLHAIAQLRFTPSLLVLTWAEPAEPDVASDFAVMVEEMLHSHMIDSVQHVTISAKTTDLDHKFLQALASIKLDISDKTLTSTTVAELCDPYIQSFRAHASDWLDSCWTDDRFDWSRYGDVMQSIRELQSALASELLKLLGKPVDVRIDTPSDLQIPSHGAAYATGPFLDAMLKSSTAHIEEVLGGPGPYIVSRDALAVSRRRFDNSLAAVSNHLLRLAALSLSSRGLQKRRTTDTSDPGSPTSTNKRMKLSASFSESDDTLDANIDTNGYHTPPPLSTVPSTAAVSEAPPKPRVTIASLRALAQEVLRSSK